MLPTFMKSRNDFVIGRKGTCKALHEWTETPVATLKFIRSAGKWRLYWMRADMKWHEYPGLFSSHRLDKLVQEIDADPLACFFG